MEIKSDYLIASFFSFLIHAMIILFLMDFFYSDKQSRPVLSKAVDVSLVFKEDIAKLKTPTKPKISGKLKLATLHGRNICLIFVGNVGE